MRDLPQVVLDALVAENQCSYARLLVEDPDGNMSDMADVQGFDVVVGHEVLGDIDQLARTIALFLQRELGRPDQLLSVAPGRETSVLNVDAYGAYAPRVDHSRRIELWAAIFSEPAEPGEYDWHLVFQGKLDVYDSAPEEMPLSGRDGYGLLLDKQVETTRTYGDEDGEPAEDVFQEILDDGLGAAAPALNVPVSPGVPLTTFEVAEGSYGEVLAAKAEEFGWYVRQKFNAYSESYEPTLFDVDPDNVTPVFTYPAGSYYRLNKYEVDAREIRNRIVGTIQDPVTGNPIVRYAEDTDSIQELGGYPAPGWYERGVRTAFISLGPESPIRSAAELDVMITAAVKALRDPPVSIEAEVPWNPFLEETDVLEFEADGRNTDSPVIAAVKGLRHTFVPGRRRTIVTGRARPAGAYLRWRRLARDRQGGAADTGAQAAFLAFDIVEVNTSEGQYTQTTQTPNAALANFDLYERDGQWPTLDNTPTGIPDSTYIRGVFGASDTVIPLRTAQPSVTRYALAIPKNSTGKVGERATASVALGAGGTGTEPPALVSFYAQQETDRVTAYWEGNATVTGTPGRYLVDLYRDSIPIQIGVAVEDGEADDVGALPCSGGSGCFYQQPLYIARLRDSLSVHPTVEYSYPLGAMWEEITL